MTLLVYSLATTTLFVIYFLFPIAAIFPVLTVLCIVALLFPLGLYIAFPNHIEMRDKGRYEPNVCDGKISMLLQTLIFPALFLVYCITKLGSYLTFDWGRFVTISAVVFAVLMAVALVFTKEYRKRPSAIFVIAIILLMIAPCAVLQINTVFDPSAEETIACTVAEKPTHTNNKGEVTYYLVVTYNGKDVKTTVSETTYANYDVGSTINVLRKKGLLGIERTVLKYKSTTLSQTPNSPINTE